MHQQRFWFQLNPIIVREMRTRMRGVRPYAILTVFLLVLLICGIGLYQLVLQQGRSGMTLLSAQVGQSLFKGLSFLELFLITLLAPALTSGAISGERESLTYDMLLATPLQPGQIVWGKLISALSYLLLLIFASVPLFSVVLVFGGVDPGMLLRTLAVLLATTLVFGAIGLFASAITRRTARATLLSYILVVVLIGIPTIIAAVWGQFSTPQGQNPPPWLIYINPFSAIQSITTIAPPSDGSGMPFFGYNDPLMALPLIGQITPGVVWYGPMGMEILPIYRGTLIWYTVLTVWLCWFSIHLSLPNRHWRPMWDDVGFVLVLLVLGGVVWFTRTWWHIDLSPDQQFPFQLPIPKG